MQIIIVATHKTAVVQNINLNVIGNLDCRLFPHALRREQLANSDFIKQNNIKTYLPPFINDFLINIQQPTSDHVIIKVYDMLGKTIETLNLSILELETLNLGENYKSGVYIIILQQGSNNETLRMIKN